MAGTATLSTYPFSAGYLTPVPTSTSTWSCTVPINVPSFHFAIALLRYVFEFDVAVTHQRDFFVGYPPYTILAQHDVVVIDRPCNIFTRAIMHASHIAHDHLVDRHSVASFYIADVFETRLAIA